MLSLLTLYRLFATIIAILFNIIIIGSIIKFLIFWASMISWALALCKYAIVAFCAICVLIWLSDDKGEDIVDLVDEANAAASPVLEPASPTSEDMLSTQHTGAKPNVDTDQDVDDMLEWLLHGVSMDQGETMVGENGGETRFDGDPSVEENEVAIRGRDEVRGRNEEEEGRRRVIVAGSPISTEMY